MSKVAIKGADTGTGVFTIESPATNTDRTITLPDEAGTILTSVSGLGGSGQSWTDVTGSRSGNVTYTNTTGYPIQVAPVVNQAANICRFQFLIDGVSIGFYSSDSDDVTKTNYVSSQYIVQNGSTYRVNILDGSLFSWWELR